MGRDTIAQRCIIMRINFNPLSPHGERRRVFNFDKRGHRFQSTLPAWGETVYVTLPQNYQWISIHSPRMGRDTGNLAGAANNFIFQSTLPAWGETAAHVSPSASPRHFNPLSPHGERPVFRLFDPIHGGISIHSPRMGRDSL